MADIRNVILIGGTGNMGGPILDALLTSKLFTISALSRVESKAVFPEGVRVIRSDYSPDGLVQALSGQDAVVCAIGGSGLGLQLSIIEAACRAGVKRFVPAEFSSNTLRDAVIKLVPLFGVKLEVIDLLKRKESSGLSWTGLTSGPTFDWGLESGFLDFDLKKCHAKIWDDGNTRFSATNLNTLGNAIVAILQRPAETANKFLFVASVTTTQNEILAALETETGKKWTRTTVSTADQVARAGKLIGEGNFAAVLIQVQASAWGNVPGIGCDFETDEQLANATLNLPHESVQETVRRVVKADNYSGAATAP